MAFQNLTEYELKRLENVRRNDQMLAARKIHSKVSEVSAAAKRSRVALKSNTVKSEKKPKTETPVVIRQSLRTRGMPPDSEGLKDIALESVNVTEKSPAKVLDPLSMRDAYEGDDEFDLSFVETTVGLAKKEAHSRSLNGEEIGSGADGDASNDLKGRSVGTSCDLERRKEEYKIWGSLKLESLTWDSENRARLVPMACQNLTEYERKRLENIRRNGEMLAALKIHSKASEVSAAAKRSRIAPKSYTLKSEKKPKTETPVVIRRSLRTRGMPPDSEGLKDIALESVDMTEISPAKVLGPLSMRDAYEGDDEFDRSFVEEIVGLAKKEAHSLSLNGEEIGSCADGDGSNDLKGRSVWTSCDLERRKEEYKVWGSLKLESLTLDSENRARLVPTRITAVQFFPSSNVKMIVAGDKFGNLGFWNYGSSNDKGNEVHLYHPHPAPISGILVQRHCLSKIYTSCYDGLVRLMDAEKEVFDLVFDSDETLYSLSQPNNDANCLYFGEGPGGLTIWDSRTGKCSSQWVLHYSRINTIDFDPENLHIMATSSSDGTACTWDLRYTKKSKPSALRTFTHQRAVHSAYFSPSGRSLATTSLDDTIGIYDGANFENASTVFHFNQTGRWLSTFRGIWGWDDSYIFVGNMKRGVDVISPVHKKIVTTLQSPHMSAIPCRFDAHPFEIGTLAGGTSGGQVYMWKSS